MGKRVYLNFLDNSLKDGSLNRTMANDPTVVSLFLTSDRIRLHAVIFARDLLNRECNIQFVSILILTVIRDFIPLRSTSNTPAVKRLLEEIVSTWFSFLTRVKSRSPRDHATTISFVFVKLIFVLHYFPTITHVKKALNDTVHLTGNTDEMMELLESTMGTDFMILAKGVCGNSKLSLPHFISKNSKANLNFLFDCIPAPATTQFGSVIPRYFPSRDRIPLGGLTVSFFDIALFVRALEPSDFLRAIPNLTRWLTTAKSTPFENMVIQFAIVGSLISGDAQPVVCDMLLTGVMSPSSSSFICTILEYLALQLIATKKYQARAAQVRDIFHTCLQQRHEKGVIIAKLKSDCRGVVSKFLSLDQLESSSVSATDILNKISQQTNEAATEKLNETSSELYRLLEAIKRRRVL